MKPYLLVGLFVIALVGWLPLSAADPSAVHLDVSSDHVDFLAGKDVVGRYQFASATNVPLAKPYLWPLYGPAGLSMTRDWPMKKGSPNESADHVHQKSA